MSHCSCYSVSTFVDADSHEDNWLADKMSFRIEFIEDDAGQGLKSKAFLMSLIFFQNNTIDEFFHSIILRTNVQAIHFVFMCVHKL